MWTFWNAWGFKNLPRVPGSTSTRIQYRVFNGRAPSSVSSQAEFSMFSWGFTSSIYNWGKSEEALSLSWSWRQANAAATGPLSLLITESYQPQPAAGGDHLPFLRLRAAVCWAGRSQRTNCWTFFFFLLFINSFFSLEVELTFFDLINYKLILRGNFLHCTLSLKICSKCQEHPPSRLLCLALELRKDTEKDKNSSAPAFLH